MVKIELILLLLIAFFNATAQDTDITAKENLQNEKTINIPRMGFSLEPLAGIGTSEAVQHGSNNLGWKAGLGLVYMFNEHWGVSSGLQVQHYSTEITTKTDTFSSYQGTTIVETDAIYITASYNFTYLELPVLLRYISSCDGKLGFFAETGFMIGYLIQSREEPRNLYDTILYIRPPNYIMTPNPSSVSLGSTTPLANSFNLQGCLVLGLFIPISPRYSLITDVSINKGFTNVGNSGNDFYYGFCYYNQLVDKYQTTPIIYNYGSNFSALFSLRLNIKLGGSK